MAQFGDQTLRTAMYRERMHLAWLAQQEEARIRREAVEAERKAQDARIWRAVNAASKRRRKAQEPFLYLFCCCEKA